MILVYKKIGQTPLDVVKILKQKKEHRAKVLSYAGRLDPMAEGVLLILEDDENKNRRRYERFDKEYEFEALIGVTTDSYDLLGIPKISTRSDFDDKKVEEFLKMNTGEIFQQYPPYSAFKIGGKPLYWWTRRKKKVAIPNRKSTVHSIVYVEKRTIDEDELRLQIEKRIMKVAGDFRQSAIIDAWQEELCGDRSFEVIKFKMTISSGGYVRSLVERLGDFLGVGATTFSIKRTKIGNMDNEVVLRI